MPMKRLKWISVILIFLTIFNFTSVRAASHKKDKALTAYNNGNYKLALTLWNKSIARYERHNKGMRCPFYTKAGMAALQLGKQDEAQQLFEKAIYSASVSPEAFIELEKIYRKINNLSLEIDVLEKYVKKYPDGKEIIPMRDRLFATYVESENWKEAIALWHQLPQKVRDSIQYKTGLLKANTALKNNHACDTLAANILKKDPGNITALDWMGKKYFWLAENRYQKELAAYAKNRTRSQYIELLQAFKKVTINFKRSLGYFRKLYALHPSSENARYLGNIYARLSVPSKAKYYQHMADKLKKGKK